LINCCDQANVSRSVDPCAIVFLSFECEQKGKHYFSQFPIYIYIYFHVKHKDIAVQLTQCTVFSTVNLYVSLISCSRSSIDFMPALDALRFRKDESIACFAVFETYNAFL